MSISTAKRGETQPPKSRKCADKMRKEAQDIVSECREHLKNLDRRFVLFAFEGGLIDAKEAEEWLVALDAGERRRGQMKSLIIEHYTAGKLSVDKVETLFRVLELEGA